MHTLTKTLTGAQIVVETLKRLDVDTIFGYPGGIVLGIYDELSRQKCIKHYLTRHEQAAVHAAEGYARSCGKCGTVIVTSGPGATNTVTGLANAYLDGYPLVVISQFTNPSKYFEYVSWSNGIVQYCIVSLLNSSVMYDIEGSLYDDIPPIITLSVIVLTLNALFITILSLFGSKIFLDFKFLKNAVNGCIVNIS